MNTFAKRPDGLNTFEKHFREFPGFLRGVLDWRPDYVVPVAKKACKLLKATREHVRIPSQLIRFKSYFELNQEPLRGKRVAVIDDATQFTSTLFEYRTYFENQGAVVRTLSFVGHEEINSGRRIKCDEKAEILRFLPEPVYQEYILQQAYFLFSSASQLDLDHVVFEAKMPKERFREFLAGLARNGKLLFVEDYFSKARCQRFSLDDLDFFGFPDFLNPTSVSLGPVRKIKFLFDPAAAKVFFSPLVFPTWRFASSHSRSDFLLRDPFRLPYPLPTTLDRRDRAAIQRAYYDIYVATVASLARAFLATYRADWSELSSATLRREDLDPTLGEALATQLGRSIKDYLLEDGGPVLLQEPRADQRHRVKSLDGFAAVLDHLRSGYRRKIKQTGRRIGVHYYIDYESLFASQTDKTALSESLDYYCDLGVVVPETISRNGCLQRGCRTGEPDADYNWARTRVLVGLVIDQYHDILKKQKYEIPAMAFNKILANLAFDYPSEIHHELHCFVGEPDTFGTLVRVYQHHRAPSKPSIYDCRKISPFYTWDKDHARFVLCRREQFKQELARVLDDRQEVPFSELVIYIRFLSEVHATFGNVDVLNLLSLTRDENWLYSHMLYNLRICSEALARYRDGGTVEDVHDAGTQCSSGTAKVGFTSTKKAVLQEIDSKFRDRLEYLKVLQLLRRNNHDFSPSFQNTLAVVEQIFAVQRGIVNLCLLGETGDSRYHRTYSRLGDLLERQTIAHLPTVSAAQTPMRNPQSNPLVGEWLNSARAAIDGLPREEKHLLARLRQQYRTRAKNLATNWVYSGRIERVALLFADFTGLRQIPEPKEDVLGLYYDVVERAISERGGQKLYGGQGGDDAFTAGFRTAAAAIECAATIKSDFEQNIFLRAAGDVKFGVATVLLPQKAKEEPLILAWGLAKDYCEHKETTFRNKGDLLTVAGTFEFLRTEGRPDLAARFQKVSGRTRDGLELFRYDGIRPIETG